MLKQHRDTMDAPRIERLGKGASHHHVACLIDFAKQAGVALDRAVGIDRGARRKNGRRGRFGWRCEHDSSFTSPRLRGEADVRAKRGAREKRAFERSARDGGPPVRFAVITGAACTATEMVEKLTKYVEMIAPFFRLVTDSAQHGVGRFHQWSPKSSLNRASSRTKSSKRRLAAVSSRSANQASPLADIAHNIRAK